MSHFKLIGAGLVAAVVVVVNSSCSNHPPAIHAPSIDAEAAGERAIEMYDTNKDGKLSDEELDKCPGLKAAAGKVGGTQGVTAEGITARIEEWQRTKIGRVPAGCRVLHNGVPLKDAEVRLVPEEFLGEGMKVAVATGKTDEGGSAMVSVPTSGARTDPEGLPPGFYRVEITKAGLDIPAKYNTETVLGTEISQETILQPIQFDLKF